MTLALPVSVLAAVHAVTVEQMTDALEAAASRGLVEQDSHGRWTATARGRSLTRELLLDIEHVNTLEENA